MTQGFSRKERRAAKSQGRPMVCKNCGGAVPRGCLVKVVDAAIKDKDAIFCSEECVREQRLKDAVK